MTEPHRIAIYSHDAMGLGHMRRNLLVADALTRGRPDAHVMLIAGAPELGAFRLPSHVDTVTLPPLRKTPESEYVPRNWGGPARDLIELRSGIIRAAVRSFAPQVLLADKLPRGILGELDPTLRELRAESGTRCVLGMRDILDHPLAVRREWVRSGNEQVILDLYDFIWVYGDPAVYDPRKEYGFSPEIASRMRFTGYLNPIPRLDLKDPAHRPEQAAIPGPYILCMVGGGQDGHELAERFMQAPLPEGRRGVLLTGPFMEEAERLRLHRAAADDPRRVVLDFTSNPGPLILGADRVVTMGGYNAVTEAVALRRPTLVVPRVAPRTEQLIRAKRFAELGLVDVLHPDKATPEALGAWLAAETVLRPAAEDCLDFRGYENLPALLTELLQTHAGRGVRPASGSA